MLEFMTKEALCSLHYLWTTRKRWSCCIVRGLICKSCSVRSRQAEIGHKEINVEKSFHGFAGSGMTEGLCRPWKQLLVGSALSSSSDSSVGKSGHLNVS